MKKKNGWMPIKNNSKASTCDAMYLLNKTK